MESLAIDFQFHWSTGRGSAGSQVSRVCYPSFPALYVFFDVFWGCWGCFGLTGGFVVINATWLSSKKPWFTIMVVFSKSCNSGEYTFFLIFLGTPKIKKQFGVQTAIDHLCNPNFQWARKHRLTNGVHLDERPGIIEHTQIYMWVQMSVSMTWIDPCSSNICR